jgi:hypothetical protein
MGRPRKEEKVEEKPKKRKHKVCETCKQKIKPLTKKQRLRLLTQGEKAEDRIEEIAQILEQDDKLLLEE